MHSIIENFIYQFLLLLLQRLAAIEAERKDAQPCEQTTLFCRIPCPGPCSLTTSQPVISYISYIVAQNRRPPASHPPLKIYLCVWPSDKLTGGS
jgi:hypothetical protein